MCQFVNIFAFWCLYNSNLLYAIVTINNKYLCNYRASKILTIDYVLQHTSGYNHYCNNKADKIFATLLTAADTLFTVSRINPYINKQMQPFDWIVYLCSKLNYLFSTLASPSQQYTILTSLDWAPPIQATHEHILAADSWRQLNQSRPSSSFLLFPFIARESWVFRHENRW